MHILFLTQVLPYPLDAGPRIRSYYTLRHLAQRHEITLLSFVRAGDSPEAVAHLRSFCREVCTVPMHRSRARDAWHLCRSLVGRVPFLIARDWVPAMAKEVSHLTGTRGGFDVVHADQLWMAPYALLRQQSLHGSSRPALLLDQHNAVFQIPRRLARDEGNLLKRAVLKAEWRKLARYEAQVCERFDQVVWVTREDQAALCEAAPGLSKAADDDRWSVIPICVDTASVRPIQRRPDAHRVLFLGGLHWPPNAEGVRWFAREVWPLVERRVAGAMLTIVGRNPPSALSEQAKATRRCEVVGYVADLQPYLAETAVFIVPLHAGGGMRVKILDAWRWGLPVVTTGIGAEGIHVRHGRNALLADTPDEFATAVARVLRQPGIGASLVRQGRRTVEDEYDWRKVYPLWDRVYDRFR